MGNKIEDVYNQVNETQTKNINDLSVLNNSVNRLETVVGSLKTTLKDLADDKVRSIRNDVDRVSQVVTVDLLNAISNVDEQRSHVN